MKLVDELWLASTWMPSPPQRPAVTLTFDIWPPEYNQVISMDWWIFTVVSPRLLKPFMRYRGNKIGRDERTNGERTAWKHSAFDDTVGWRRRQNEWIFPSCCLLVSWCQSWKSWLIRDRIGLVCTGAKISSVAMAAAASLFDLHRYWQATSRSFDRLTSAHARWSSH